MDWLTFFSKIIEAVAWPGTLVILLVVIRKELPGIARSLRRLKYKDVELEFGEATKAIENEIKAAVPAAEIKLDLNIGGQLKSEARTRLLEISGLAPRAAILEAWLLVEAAAADVIRKKNLARVTSAPGPLQLMQNLQKGGLLRPRQLGIFEQLRALRNEAVHAPHAHFSQEAVASYIESAVAMAAYLEGLGSDAL